jgi:hypothetical protein
MIRLLWQFAPALLIFVGAVVVAIGGFWGAFRQAANNAEIKRLTIENAGLITGGDTIAEVYLQIDTQRWTGTAVPTLVNEGKYPLYDIELRLVDVDEVRREVDQNLPSQDALLGKTFRISNLTPGMAREVDGAVQHAANSRDYNYNIFVVARNGSWTQQLRMKWIGDGWVRATRIVRDGKEVRLEVPDAYPRNAAGEVEWEPKPTPSK